MRRFPILPVLLLSSCTSGPVTPPDDETIEIFFRAESGGEPLLCGAPYPVDGLDGTIAGYLIDLRFFVHDVRLVAADGAEHPLALDDDGLFQAHGVGLLDFEDAMERCSMGTVAQSKTLRGSLAPHDPTTFTKIRFRLGVPAELDRTELTDLLGDGALVKRTPSGGHVFLSAWGAFTAQDAGVDLASADCTQDPVEGAISCARSNRPEIELEGFDPASSTIVFDWDALFAAVPLKSGPASCATAEDMVACSPYFTALGLDWQTGASAGTPKVFRLESQ